MSSNINVMMPQNDPSQQQNTQPQDISKTDLNKASNSNDDKKDKNKGKISKKALIIIVASIIAVVIIVTIIIVFAIKKDDVEKKPIIIQENPSDLESITIYTDLITTDYFDSDDNLVDYNDAIKLIGLNSIIENHNILNETSNNIDKILSFYNNTNIIKINATINDDPENLEFLIDTNESSLQVARDDLDIYISKYSSLSEQTNILSNEIFEYINIISSTELKNENENITIQFEKNIQNLAIPFLSNQTKLRNLFSDELKNQIEKLNTIYKKFFNITNLISEKIVSSINFIIDTINLLNIKINDNILKVNEIIESINNGTKIHEKLIEIKNITISLRKDVDNIIIQFDKENLETSEIINDLENFDSFIKEEKEIIFNINNILLETRKNEKNILSKRRNNDKDNNPQIEPLIESNTNSIKTTIEYTDIFIGQINDSCYNFEISTVETSTSLDLLFIVDMTGSMRPYLEEIKRNLINIINGIISGCPGININLGFIG